MGDHIPNTDSKKSDTSGSLDVETIQNTNIDVNNLETTTKVSEDGIKQVPSRDEVADEKVDLQATIKKETQANVNADDLASPAEPYVLQIDTTDNLDVYLEKAKNDSEIGATTDKAGVALEEVVDKPQENHEKGEIKEESTMNNAKNEEVGFNSDDTKTNTGDTAEKNVEMVEENNEVTTHAKESSNEDSKKVLDVKEVAKEKNLVKIEQKDKDKSKVDDKIKPPSKTSKDNPKCIWVSNISRDCKASDLKMHLSKFGKVITAKIVTDGKLFYGYVIMEKPEDVNCCVKNLDGSYFEGKKIGLSNKGPDTIKDAKDSHKSRGTSASKSISGKSSIKDRSKPDTRRQPTPKLQNKSPKSRRHRSDMVREMEILKRRLLEEDRRREERRREERLREREREERRQLSMEYRLKEARKKLEQEREAFEKEKLALIKLQRIIADEERSKLKREKDNLKKEYKSLEAGLKRRKSEPRDFDRKKMTRAEVPQSERRRGLPYKDEQWRFEDKMQTKPPGGRVGKVNDDYKYKKEYFSPKSSKIGEDKLFCVPPPPPKLSEEFDYGRRNAKNDIEDSSGCYRKMDYLERSHRMEIMERREERKPGYPEHREKKMQEKNVIRYQADYAERNGNERKVKYPSAIGGFPNGKPDFLEGKHYGKQEVPRNIQQYQPEFHGASKCATWGKSMGPVSAHSSAYMDNWKPESNICSNQRYHGQPFAGPSYGVQQNVPEYYPQDGRYDYHGRKY